MLSTSKNAAPVGSGSTAGGGATSAAAADAAPATWARISSSVGPSRRADRPPRNGTRGTKNLLRSIVTLLPWPDDRDEELRAVRNAAFGDHWGSTVVEPDAWRDFVRGHGSRPDLSVVAVDDATGEVLGLSANQCYPEDEAVTGRRDAWIANICTVRAARGRGVASAMLAWSLAAFAEAGFSHAALEVDTDNPTNAARLYRNLGFEPHLRSITFEIEL